MEWNDTVASIVDPSFATGALLRGYVDSTLGDLDMAEANVLATSAASDPRAMGEFLGLSEQQSLRLDPVEMRNRIMGNYFAQRFARDLAATLDETMDEDSAELEGRLDRYAQASGASPEQLDDAMRRAAVGDCSSLNRMEEMYFFE